MVTAQWNWTTVIFPSSLHSFYFKNSSFEFPSLHTNWFLLNLFDLHVSIYMYTYILMKYIGLIMFCTIWGRIVSMKIESLSTLESDKLAYLLKINLIRKEFGPAIP